MATTRTAGTRPEVLMCELSARDEAAAGAVLTGPAAPLPFVPAPGAGLPAWSPEGAAGSVWWVGCHGGAGESTLAGLFGGSVATGHRWPALPARLPGRPAAVVLVARTSHAGLAAAQRALTQWAAGDTPAVDLLGLVLSADVPGRLPRPLRDYARLVGGGAPRVWALPWIGAWRSGEPACPRPVARLLAAVGALLPPAGLYPDPVPPDSVAPGPIAPDPVAAGGSSSSGASKEGC